MVLSKGSLDIPKYKGVRIFKCFYPAKISNFLGILWGVYNSDVVFVLRGNHYKFMRLCLNLFGKKSFKRQGNKIDNEIVRSIASAVGGENNISDSYNFCTEVYSPTKSIGEYNFKKWGVKYNSQIFLPPFINTSGFQKSQRKRESVNNIVFVGNDMLRKNISFFLQISKTFRSVKFHVIGKEPLKGYFDGYSANLIYHGTMPPVELSSFLDNMDLHCFTSKSEGFGKVTIEMAAKGIPSILFDNYGAGEWLRNQEEGVIVSTDEEYEVAIKQLISDPEYYKKLQDGCVRLTGKFSIENQLSNYEQVIRDLYAS